MSTKVAMPAPTRRIAGALLAAWLCSNACLGVTAHAEVALYQAVVPLKGTTEADRGAALGEALKVVAVRASGRTDAATAPKIVSAAAQPAGYVQQYATTSGRLLKVGFDERAIEQLLQQAGLPFWPAERPAVTVLLYTPAVAGGGRAVTSGERAPERVELERAAQLRGLPLAWPSEIVDAAGARARSGAPGSATLVGQGAGGSIDWTFTHAGQTARATGPLEAGADLAADELAKRYAPASTRAVTSVTLRIGGLNGVRDYAALLEYLEALSLVKSLGVREFVRDSVEVELTVRGDRDLLARIFALDDRLAPASVGAAGVDFVWQAT